MTGGTPPRGAHPRVLLAAAAQTLGEEEVVTWCARLLRGEDRPDDPDLAWLGGTDDWLPYWRRVWGARGLLYVWSDEALEAVAAGLSDPHWRVREAALRVVRPGASTPWSRRSRPSWTTRTTGSALRRSGPCTTSPEVRQDLGRATSR